MRVLRQYFLSAKILCDSFIEDTLLKTSLSRSGQIELFFSSNPDGDQTRDSSGTTSYKRAEKCADIKEIKAPVTCKVGFRILGSKRHEECRNIKEVEHAIVG